MTITQFQEDWRNAYQDGSYLLKLGGNSDLAALSTLRAGFFETLQKSELMPFQIALDHAPQVTPSTLLFDQSSVIIGSQSDIAEDQYELLERGLQTFIPWKKGPFSIFGREIDAEWRSDYKWQRIEPYTLPLEGKVIADIGCNNGYFMYRMLPQRPKLVLGFEPYAKHWFNFQWMQKYTRQDSLIMDLYGIEHMHLFEECFDVIFCLGILYHHTDPIELLRKMRRALKPGGQIIIDCQGIAGAESVSLMPAGRYANARGIWHLPTKTCLLNWIKRTNYRDYICFFEAPLGVSEQRRTEWAPVDSLNEFLDANDKSKTIEGYPAPYRFYVKALK